MLSELKDSLSARGLVLDWTEEAAAYLVKQAFSVTYGARNLRRTIQKELEDPISEVILDRFDDPASVIHVTMEDGKIKLIAE